jgi:rubredoxin
MCPLSIDHGARVTERARRSNEILGARVIVTAIAAGREDDVAGALADLAHAEPPASLPAVVVEKTSVAAGDQLREALEEAGATVEIEDAWVTRDEVPDDRPRPVCPSCGSTKTQPFLHAGPAARVNMRCRDCGHTFRAARS